MRSILNEEFKYEDVEDPSQGFVDWDFPPTYDDDVSEVDSNERPLSFNLEEEYEEDGSFPMFDGLCPEEEDPLGEEEPTDDVAEYYEKDEDLIGEVPNYCDEELCYVDFFGVDDILSDSHDSNCDDFYVDEENYMKIKETMIDLFLSIFMACGREKVEGSMASTKYGKLACGAFKIIIIIYQ